ncbi:ABC transporter permease [Peribacillus frigoritolerans]|uniref:ABC transporter permease n=1 Tax=Peribacillus frigoritolerans TaxID=450367 RepID=UPI0032B32A8D
MKSWLMNPVLNKEFKLRFRSFKSFLGVLFYVLAIGAIVIGMIFIQSLSNIGGHIDPDSSRSMFIFLAVVQLALILFITPGLTAGVISSERERQTLNILLTTSQSSTGIVFGKLISSISYLLLLVVASLPLYSIVFLFGGISPAQLLMVLGFNVFTVIVYGSIGVLFSTLVRKTIAAMVTTYGVTLFLVGGTALLTLLFSSMALGMQGNSATPTTNPLPYIAAMLNTPIVMIGFIEPTYSEEIQKLAGIDFPLWAAHLICYTLLLIGAVLLSVKKLRVGMKARR